jgi:hypothetical protein
MNGGNRIGGKDTVKYRFPESEQAQNNRHSSGIGKKAYLCSLRNNQKKQIFHTWTRILTHWA